MGTSASVLFVAHGLRKRDRIRSAFRANGEVVLQRVCPDSIEEDPVSGVTVTAGGLNPLVRGQWRRPQH